jgi:hypothetical protein
MKHLFVQDELQINLNRRENKLTLSIYSMYTGSNRKSQLYVNGDRLGLELESLWKSIKTTKLKLIQISFDEQDWYDDEVDVYETPVVTIKRGLRKCKIGERSHGSIPKEWGVEMYCIFEDLQTKKPVLDVIKSILGSYFTTEMEKKFVKQYNPIIKQVPQVEVK